MQIRETMGRRVFVVINTLVLALLGFVCLAPMWHTLCASFSDPILLAGNKGLLFLPLGEWTVKGYQIVFANPSIWTGYSNTLFYVVAGTLVSVSLTALAAFVFSRKHFLLSNPLMLFASFTMLFNGGMIPNFILVQKLGLLDSRWSVVLPTAINVFNMVILRTAFQEIPDSLEESAKLDGASDLYIFVRIILPLSKATLSVIILFVAVSHWNSWFTASLYLNSRSKYPLQIILRELLVDNSSYSVGSDASVNLYKVLIKYCTILVATVPILVIYPFIQKYFTKGVMIGAIKG